MKIVLLLTAIGAGVFAYFERPWRWRNVPPTASTNSGLTCLDQGRAPRVTLDAWFKNGATKRSIATFGPAASAVQPQLGRIPVVGVISNRVLEATPREARVEWKLESIDVARSKLPANADVDVLQRWLASFSRPAVVRRFRPEGRVIIEADEGVDAGVTDRTMLRPVLDALILVAPEIPVGPGARWRLEQSKATAEYELVAHENGRIKMRISMSTSESLLLTTVTVTTNAEVDYMDGDPLPHAGEVTLRSSVADGSVTPATDFTLSIAPPP